MVFIWPEKLYAKVVEPLHNHGPRTYIRHSGAVAPNFYKEMTRRFSKQLHCNGTVIVGRHLDGTEDPVIVLHKDQLAGLPACLLNYTVTAQQPDYIEFTLRTDL